MSDWEVIGESIANRRLNEYLDREPSTRDEAFCEQAYEEYLLECAELAAAGGDPGEVMDYDEFYERWFDRR